MLSSALLLVATALSGLANAQFFSTSGPLAIDPNSEPLDLRGTWCISQTNLCPKICGGVASVNTCDQNTLDYTCTCQSGATPNISNYINTMPFFVCEAWITFCVAGHPNDGDGQAACHSVQCGNETVDDTTGSSGAVSTSVSSTPATTTSSSGSSPTGGSGAAVSTSASPSATPAHNAAVAVMKLSGAYATSFTAVGLLAIFGLAL